MAELTYSQALSYLYSLTDYEKTGFAAYAPEFYDLARMARLLELLDNPQRWYGAVHVAGTKGKGSTSAMVESVLRVAGYTTGLYTSPHLHTFRERIRLRGEFIPETDVVRLVQHMQPFVEQVPEVTTFEVMTGLAFTWFAEQRADWVVLEVGLGGRLDATNVIVPAVAVITSISLDHTAILGETVAQIAGEKAGIVKPGVPVVSAPQVADALGVIEAVCRRQNAPLTLVGRDWDWRPGPADLDGQSFAIHHGTDQPRSLWLPLLGAHQLENATVAVASLDILRSAGAHIPEAAIRHGLRMVSWPGRLEILSRAPLVVVDSAHNGDSAQKLMAALRSYLDYRSLVLVLGASADHLTEELMSALLADARLAIATRSRHARAAPPERIAERAATLGYCMEISQDVADALELALSSAQQDDLVLCTGSVFVAAEARAAWFAWQGTLGHPSDPT